MLDKYQHLERKINIMAKDTELYHLSNDIQKIQVKTNMYIYEYGKAGSFHLAREVIQNQFDECLDEDSEGNDIQISFDINTGIITCTDNGRSFNESKYPMATFCTTLQSGSKFFRNAGSPSAGEFGVGMTVVNALSDYYKMVAYRSEEQTVHTIEFSEGTQISDKWGKNTNGRHGTIVEFHPSKKYLGDDCDIPIDEVIDWIDQLFYLDSKRLESKGINCTVTVWDGIKAIKTVKLKPHKFEDMLSKMLPANLKKKDMSDKVVLSNGTTFVEKAKALKALSDGTSEVIYEDVEKMLNIDMAFQYCISPDVNDNACYETYCNYTHTKNNGTHLDTFEEVFCRFMQNEVTKTIPESKRDKLKILWDDVRTNLYCVISLTSNAAVGFVGNAKDRIDCKTLIPQMKQVMTESVEKYFKENPDMLMKYVKIVKLNATARQEATKAKIATQTENVTNLKALMLTNFIPCNNTGKQWKEIFLVEGDSARGSARNGSVPDRQAFYMFRGVPLNVFGKKLTEVMENNEWKGLVNVLKCGIGKTFDINKLYYDRINIFTDADIDGFFISASILVFFYTWMPQVIEQGKLYKVFSPLYRLDDKDNPFVANKAELISLYYRNIIKAYKFAQVNANSSNMNKDEFMDFLIDTYDYRDALINAADQSGKINKFLVEAITAFLVLKGVVRSENDYDDPETLFTNKKFVGEMMTFLKKKFPELTINERGIVDCITEGKRYQLAIDRRFYRKNAVVIEAIHKYGYLFKVSNKNSEDAPKTVTLGEFLDMAQKQMPDIKTRFKGLTTTSPYKTSLTAGKY